MSDAPSSTPFDGPPQHYLGGIALRLLRVREDLPVAAMLPALVVAPLLTELVLRLS